MTADRVKAILAAAGVPTTSRNLAEALWLAGRIADQQRAAGEHMVAGSPADAGQLPAGIQPETLRPDAPATSGDDPAAGTLRVAGPRRAGSAGGQTVQVPAAPMLRDVLAVQRAVRPLKRRTGSGRRRRLDETGTAARIADTGIWVPVLAEELEPWLDLALVVDTGPAMRLWHPLARELREAIGRVGAFRDVRVSYLIRDRLSPSPGGPLADAASLVDPGGRRAVLILSDCSGGHWWSGRAAGAVHTWARRGPTAILQPLPERMWHRTGAPVLAGTASSRFPGAPNAALHFVPDLPPLALPPQALPVPVLELDPVWLRDWATLVAGRGLEAARTAITYVSPYPGVGRRERVLRESTLSPADRVRRFQEVASPEAARLAAHIAVSVPALPVMRLIQHTMVPGAQLGHLGEVLLSGLLRPTGPDLYEFIDEEVRELLLAMLPRSESWHTIDVLRHVSAGIARRAGRAQVTFSAVFQAADPDTAVADPADRPFALVSDAAVRSLSNLAVPLRPAAERSAPPILVPSPRRSPSHNDAGPMFFLSYARTPRRDPREKDDPDRWVYKLYRDLCGEILQLTDIDPDRVGFMDRDINVDRPWSSETAHALATCRVFVPLYSRRYFQSDSCGKEWFAFARRQLNSRALTGGQDSAVVPVLWTRVARNDLPVVAQVIQYEDAQLGARYLADGIYGIMKIANYRSDYQRTIFRLAQRIVEIGAQSPPGTEEPADFASLSSAFGRLAATGAGSLQISLFAPHLDALPQGRSSAYYGESARDWRPYQPESAVPIGDYSAQLTSAFGLASAVGVADQQVAEWASTGGPDSPTLFVVDPWTALSPPHAEGLRLLDGFEQHWLGVIVPWNTQDAETVGATPELRRGLWSLLGRRLARETVRSAAVPSLQEFGEVLPGTVQRLTRRYLTDAPVGPPIKRPRLRKAPEYEVAEPLSDRELEVLQLLSGTLSLREIADVMHVSLNTVKTHTASVYRKLGVSARRDAVVKGRRLELL